MSLMKVAQLTERRMLRVSDDDMVGHREFEQFTGADEVARDAKVGVARRRVAARVIVHERNGVRARDDGRTEHLPRMDEHGVEQTDRHDLMPHDPKPGV